MESERVEQGFVREWSPCTRMISLIPPRVHTGLFSTELRLTSIDAVSEYIALGTNVGLVYWYSRKNGTIERLRCEANQSGITCVKIVNTVDYMVAAGNTAGQVTVFQIPKAIPDSIPDALKPKSEPKVERYTVGDLHKSQITAIEWSKNGMRLFSGDKNGVIIMTEIDFYMHLCKSVEIVNERFEIVQISYYKSTLLVSSLYRTILCENKEGRWQINQVGKKERKSLCALGAVIQCNASTPGTEVAAYCARPGLRVWSIDRKGEVQHTLLFKDAVNNPRTVAELLNPSQMKHPVNNPDYQFGPMHIFREHFLVTHNQDILYILDPSSLSTVAVVDDLRRIMSVSVNKGEIFILEGQRSVVRLGHSPEIDTVISGNDPLNAMTKSLTTSIQLAMNTVRELAQSDPITPFITSIIDHTTQSFEVYDKAEECFELPPIEKLPSDVSLYVLESMVDSYEDQQLKPDIDNLHKKMKIINMIAEPKRNDELIYSSKRNKKTLSANNTPKGTPVRRLQPAKNQDCKANGVSRDASQPVCGNNATEEDDEEIIKQIEEKEKILAKMLDLEFLITKPIPSQEPQKSPEPQISHVTRKVPMLPFKNDIMTRSYPVMNTKKHEELPTLNTVETSLPKMTQVPKNWNLRSLTVDLDPKAVEKEDDLSFSNIENEWEII